MNTLQQPTVRVKRKRGRYKIAQRLVEDNNRRTYFKHLKKQEDRILPKNCFNVFTFQNWLV